MNEAYCKLIDQFCRAEGLQPPDKPDGLLSLSTGDAVFFISPVDDGDGVRLLLTVHYGEMPPQASALAYRRLLEANVQAFDSLQPKFGIDAETGSVVVTGTLPLKSMTAALLSEVVTEQAMLANDWRRTRFLTTEDAARETSPGRACPPSDVGSTSPTHSLEQRFSVSTLRR